MVHGMPTCGGSGNVFFSLPAKYGLAAARSDHADNLSGERDPDGGEGGVSDRLHGVRGRARGALAPLFQRRRSNWRDIVLRILGDCARCMEQAWRTDGELRTLPLILVESFVRKPLPPLPSGKLPDLAPILLLPPSRWQKRQGILRLHLTDLDMRTVRRGNRLIPGVKVVRAALRGRLDPVDGILENAGARTAFEARKRLLFWVGKALTSVKEDKILERRVTVAEVLKRQRMMGSREGRLKTLAEWLESRLGSAAGRETPGRPCPPALPNCWLSRRFRGFPEAGAQPVIRATAGIGRHGRSASVGPLLFVGGLSWPACQMCNRRQDGGVGMFRGQDRDFGEPGYVKAGLAGAVHFHEPANPGLVGDRDGFGLTGLE